MTWSGANAIDPSASVPALARPESALRPGRAPVRARPPAPAPATDVAVPAAPAAAAPPAALARPAERLDRLNRGSGARGTEADPAVARSVDNPF
jgi:hypothetical protein